MLPTVFGLKLQVTAAVTGQERTILFGESGVGPLGVTETVMVPVPFERVRELWLLAIVNAACTAVTVIGAAGDPR